MFYKYEIRHDKMEDVLYLYLTMNYEFGEEFSLHNETDLKRRTKNFIASHSIPNSFAILCAVILLSPVIIITLIPASLQILIESLTSSLGGSIIA